MLKRGSVLAFAAIASIGLSACYRTINLELPAGTPVILSTADYDPKTTMAEPHEAILPPNAPEYARLQKWLAKNRHGWWQAVAADPAGGVAVTAGRLHLHFVDQGVSASVPGGIVVKKVSKDDYAYLEEAAAHLTNR